MKNILKKRIKFIVIVIGVFLAINIALSFAYIRGGSLDSESVSTVALEGGSINVRYSSNTGNIVANNIVPGYETTKQFTISSEYGQGHEYYNLGLWYQINLVVDRNDFNDNSLTYSLTLVETSDDDGVPATNVEYVGIPSGQNLNGIAIGAGKLINDNKSHIYKLKLSYAETLADQSEEIGSRFEAHITITNPKIVKIIFDLDGGEINTQGYNKISKSVTASVNSLYTLPTPYKAGYLFDGWEKVSGNGSIDGNILSVNEENIELRAIFVSQSFAEDTWEEIATNVKNGNTDGYNVGDTKEIAIEGLTNTEAGSNGLFTIRIANKSTPSECASDAYSQTACGFVVEFVDIVEQRRLTSTDSNAGGWPSSVLRTYLNSEFITKLPSDLQNAIILTKSISGYGSGDSGNLIATDKVYLFSTKEIWGNCDSSTCYDTATTVTRQLDYYANYNVTTSEYSAAAKLFNGAGTWYWTRSAQRGSAYYFKKVLNTGGVGQQEGYSGGIAPAFRIG